MTYKRGIVAVDLDGTLAPHPTPDVWGREDTFLDPFDGAKEFLERLHEEFRIIIYTCRCTVNTFWGNADEKHLSALVAVWMGKHKLPYDEIWTGQGKPVCDLFIDDRAISCNPTREDSMSEYRQVMARVWRSMNKVEPMIYEDKIT